MTKLPSEFNRVMALVANEQFEENERGLYAEGILAAMEQKYPEIVAEDREKNWRHGAIRRVTNFLKKNYVEREIESSQLGLPGLPAPGVIAVKEEDSRYRYVQYSKAKWRDLEASASEKRENIEHAVEHRRDHQRKMDYLREVMEGTDLTVEEALVIIDGQQDAAE